MFREPETDDSFAFSGDLTRERTDNLKNHVSPVRSRPSAQSTFIGESENSARTDHLSSPPRTIRLHEIGHRLALSLYAMAADAAAAGFADVASELHARAFRLDVWASDRNAR